MKTLTKESIYKAIQKIDANPHLVKGRESFQYDLIQNGKRYPPILVISEAHKILGGEELMLSDFGNNARKAFQLLEVHGFKVVEKSNGKPKIWFVCQGSSFASETGKKFIWAPKTDKNGNPKFFWENMKKVRQGDFIFNYSKGIRGISIAKTDYYEAENPWEATPWEKKGYKVDIEFHEFVKPIDINDLKKRKNDIDRALASIPNKPFNSEGGVNQGFLYEFSLEAGKIILNIYGKNIQNETIQNFFKMVDVPPIGPGPQTDLKEFSEFEKHIADAGLLFSQSLIIRFIASLLTKPFVILSGLSGSGKTKLAQAFVKWICHSRNQYRLIPVGADWTNREPLLGYPNALNQKEYVTSGNDAVELILHAVKHPDLPHFLILDEMNLSHVERYFADFLSVMESNDELKFHSSKEDISNVPSSVKMPENLFIIGTINVDETTYMFSPKVLDRANVIEFRLNENDIQNFLYKPSKPNLEKLEGEGKDKSSRFLSLAKSDLNNDSDKTIINKTLVSFFTELKKTGAEFGYRSAHEIHRLIHQLTVLDKNLKEDEKLDIAIMQKLLPKLHGSRRKLCPILVTLGNFCINQKKFENIEKEIFSVDYFDVIHEEVKYPLSLEKIIRMYKNAIDNGFASYAEA